jgi:hypothetical protein
MIKAMGYKAGTPTQPTALSRFPTRTRRRMFRGHQKKVPVPGAHPPKVQERTHQDREKAEREANERKPFSAAPHLLLQPLALRPARG